MSNNIRIQPAKTAGMLNAPLGAASVHAAGTAEGFWNPAVLFMLPVTETEILLSTHLTP